MFQLVQRRRGLVAQMTTELQGEAAEDMFRQAVNQSGAKLSSPILISVQLGLVAEATRTNLAAYVERV